MRIVSKTRDYYDVVMKQGVDRSLVFHRHERRVATPLSFPWFKHRVTPPYWQVAEKVVGFCGQVYCGLNIYKVEGYPDKFGRYKVDEICYTQAQVEKLINAYWGKANLRAYYDKKVNTKTTRTFTQKAVKAFFAECKRVEDSFASAFVDNNTPMFEATQEGWRRDASAAWLLNCDCNLKQLGFIRVFPPYQAYQEISMFLSGVLGLTREHGKPKYKGQKMSSDVSDSDLAAAKGFDRYSFRKDKQNGKT
jgi:hypothetical protein